VIEIYVNPEWVPPENISLAIGRRDGRNESRKGGRNKIQYDDS
jgi:hypothetical protein